MYIIFVSKMNGSIPYTFNCRRYNDAKEARLFTSTIYQVLYKLRNVSYHRFLYILTKYGHIQKYLNVM